MEKFIYDEKVVVRTPSDQEYASFNGLHCFSVWRSLSENWRCPVCDRTKRQIMIWGRRVGSNAQKYGEIGFKCGLHEHHDHSVRERFESVVICGSCNLLDARLKRFVGADSKFSFSPSELKSVLKNVVPNKGIDSDDINYALVIEIYEKLKSKRD